MQWEFRKGREVDEPKRYSLAVGHVDDDWVENELIEDKILNDVCSHFGPVGTIPRSWRFFVAEMLLKWLAPSEIARRIEQETDSLDDDVDSYRSNKNKLHLVLYFLRPTLPGYPVGEGHYPEEKRKSSSYIDCSLIRVPLPLYVD